MMKYSENYIVNLYNILQIEHIFEYSIEKEQMPQKIMNNVKILLHHEY